MNAEEKRDMYRAFLIQVMKFPTLSEKLLEVLFFKITIFMIKLILRKTS